MEPLPNKKPVQINKQALIALGTAAETFGEDGALQGAVELHYVETPPPPVKVLETLPEAPEAATASQVAA